MKISIITINYNNLHGLKKTVRSVLEQTYANVEYIVIDGGSKDGSAEFIYNKADEFAYWVSEPDKGIYHAMNKGIELATGEYLLFLNSGDWLYNSQIIQHVVNKNDNRNIVYGNIILHSSNGNEVLKKMPKVLDVYTLLKTTITHQAIFHHKSLFKKGARYSLSYKYSSDWVFYVRAILNGATYKSLTHTIAYYDTTGITSQNAIVTNELKKERERFLKQEFSFEFNKLLDEYLATRRAYVNLMNSRLVRLLIFLKPSLKKYVNVK